jgi:hypothetical protein
MFIEFTLFEMVAFMMPFQLPQSCHSEMAKAFSALLLRFFLLWEARSNCPSSDKALPPSPIIPIGAELFMGPCSLGSCSGWIL